MSMGLQPTERFSHGLRLDANELGKLGLRHGALGVEDLNGNNPGVGKTNSAEFFVP